MAEWLLSWDLRPCMDMKTRSHWAHGWPPAASRCFSWPSDTTALAAATKAAALPSPASVSGSRFSTVTAASSESLGVAPGLSRPSTSAASSPSMLPLVRLSEGRIRGTSLTSCCNAKRGKVSATSQFMLIFICQHLFSCGCWMLKWRDRFNINIASSLAPTVIFYYIICMQATVKQLPNTSASIHAVTVS